MNGNVIIQECERSLLYILAGRVGNRSDRNRVSLSTDPEISDPPILTRRISYRFRLQMNIGTVSSVIRYDSGNIGFDKIAVRYGTIGLDLKFD